MQQSYRSLDITKFFCSILVIIIHTGPLEDFNGEIDFFLCQVLSRIAVPFFFTCSGFLFYRKIVEWENKKEYVLTYLKRLITLYLLWSVIYLYWNFDFSLIGTDTLQVLKAAAWYIWQGIFIGSHFHLWFIPALIFAITVLYFSVIYNIRTQLIIFFFIMYLVGLFGDSYYGFAEDFIHNNNLDIYFRYFGSTYNGLFFGAFFVLMGSFLSNDSENKNHYLPLSVLFFLLLTGEAFLLERGNIPKDYNMYVMLGPFTYCFFNFLLGDKKESTKLTKTLRNYSMDIYFSHCLFIIFLPKVFAGYDLPYNSLIRFIGVTSLTIAFCSIKTVIASAVKRGKSGHSQVQQESE